MGFEKRIGLSKRVNEFILHAGKITLLEGE
jgi:hypothetical protein